MIRFLDGPARGVTLELARVPIMLRVVHNRLTDRWDALDQPNDVADPDEEIHVYRLSGPVDTIHLYCRPRSRSRWIHGATYVYHGRTHSEVRDNGAWSAWCDERRHALMARYQRSREHLRRRR